MASYYKSSAIGLVSGTLFGSQIYKEQHVERINEVGLGDTLIADAACGLQICGA